MMNNDMKGQEGRLFSWLLGMDWFKVYYYEVAGAIRIFQRKIREHTLIIAWFFLLYVAFFWFFMQLFVLVIRGSFLLDIEPPEPENYIFLFFFLFTGKSVVNTLNLLKKKRLENLFSSPLHTRSVVAGELLFIVIMNLLILSFSAVIVVNHAFLLDFHEMFAPYAFLKVIVLTITSTAIGFSFAILSRRKTWKLLFIVPTTTAATFLINAPNNTTIPIALIVLVMGTATAMWSGRYIVEAWNAGCTSAPKKKAYLNILLWLIPEKYLRGPFGKVLRKELVIFGRNYEDLAGLITVSMVMIGITSYSQGLLEEVVMQGEYARYVYPAVAGMAIFVVAVLESGMNSLSAIGKESKALWIIRTIPVESKSIMLAKGLAAIRLTPIMVVLIGIPVPLVLGYSWEAVVFSVLGVLTMSLAFSGIGLWLSGKFPNFDSSPRGTPDIMVAYVFTMGCLILGFILTFYPVFIFFRNEAWGAFAMAIALLFSGIIFREGVNQGAQILDRLAT